MHPDTGPSGALHADAVPAGYALAVVGSAIAAGAAALAERWLGSADVPLIFMLAVLLVAARSRTGPAIVAAVLCFLCYTFLFIEPRYTFYIGSQQGLTAASLFLAVALVGGRLASRLGMQVQALRQANLYAKVRHDLSGALVRATAPGQIVGAARSAFRRTLDAEVWIQLAAEGRAPAHGGVLSPAAGENMAGLDMDAGAGPGSVEESGWWFLPLRAQTAVLGQVGLKLADPGELDASQRDLARAMTNDVAQAVLRMRLAADLEAERIAGETERLRSALLASVSHDLRTPLAGIIGAAGSLESYGESMDRADRRSLLETIREEGERLDRYIQNLLDMTRLGQGGLTLERDWIGVDELAGSALSRVQRQYPGVRFAFSMPPGMEPIWVHPALLEQALVNVLENAARFSPAGEPVAITARSVADGLEIDICDRGPGIPEAERRRVFDMFYSVERGDAMQQRPASGLGLAICRGMVGAHGGDVEALAGPDGRGTIIRIRLPRMRPPQGPA